MVNIAAVKTRVGDLLTYFSAEYVKAYKAALVESLRDAANGGGDDDDGSGRPEFTLPLLDEERLPVPLPRIEGVVHVGAELKDLRHWTMDKKFIVTQTEIKKDKAAAASSPTSPMSPMSPSSPSGSGGFGAPDASRPDQRVWLDDSASDVCMNQACGDKFGLLNRRRHCRHCGEIFCSKCREFRIPGDKEQKFCEPCFKIRTSVGSGEAQLPLLKRPEGRSQRLSFFKYKVELHDSEMYAKAGAAAAAAKAKATLSPKLADCTKSLLVLSHRRANRPQLLLGFDSEEVRDQWRSLLQTASWASPSPLNADPLLRKAFLRAFEKLRWRAWVWGGWELDGTEAELLTDVLSEVLERELSSELSSLPDMARTMTRKVIYRATIAAVDTAWKSLMKSMPAVRGPVEAAAGQLLGPAFAKEKEVKDMLQGKIEEAAAKALDKAGDKMSELFEKQLPVLSAAAEAQLGMLRDELAELHAKLSGGDNQSASHFESEFGWLRWRTNWQWSGRQGLITEMLYAKLVRDDGANDATRKLGYWLVDDMRLLNQSALVVIQQAIKDRVAGAGEVGVPQLLAAMRDAYADVMTRTATDLTLLYRWRLTMALDSVLRDPLLESTAKVVESACEPVQALVPEALSDIVDPTRTATEIIEDVLDTQETALADQALKTICSDAKNRGVQLIEKGMA